MYLIGLDHRSRALYSTLTIMISLPATIKVVNWTFSLMNGALKIDAALYASISFIFFFLVAGFTGMWLSHVSLNISMHDTMYVVAHFHYVLSMGAVFGLFAGFYFWAPKIFGKEINKKLGELHYWTTFIGVNLTFFPMHFSGIGGMPRRIPDYPDAFYLLNVISSIGSAVTVVSIIVFVEVINDLLYWRKRENIYISNVNEA